MMVGDELNQKATQLLKQWVLDHSDRAAEPVKLLNPHLFEKDDDSHIDFIHTTSNLRALMYRLEPTERSHSKKISGHIVPAIATTTACVAGLVTLEIVRWVKELVKKGSDQREIDMEKFRNGFLNLALPMLMFSQPAPAKKKKVLNNLFLTDWDKLTVTGDNEFTLQMLKDSLETKYTCEMTMLVMGDRLIYLNVMPQHKVRLSKRMLELCPPKGDMDHVDLVVSLEDPSDSSEGLNDDDTLAPTLRYYYGLPESVV